MSKELVERLRIVANMINMGENIRWGEETALMDEDADLLERQDKLIQDMFTLLINRCDQQDPKVKDVLIRAIELQPDTPEEGG